ncbi:2,3,4,5-tetrahydropyridine-2,6-dicarboxylate N-succinyltransferase [Coxiella endosymbiont of Amblyomma nuttalli]|uniref:2,3,4,5-tetrahydropyridine-2,6-dicarboxylate N-succinyltransferase n=1 Tax=Coxiella endosymbiont of Amblyomma nuttalli TaxID=2749996 RepID=UPI001BAB70E9|nr:2,3,4,5-tetrahydropyridine-2,6-dicarboxylate N-succinyltransferase [Coxiella endosymbiont of Amblyomma nuttalli]QTS84151.1 2,3,4,5-tetrahydropyridine-2,6-dicarboxylate N-succinyltransferase [Coxiella endosymbiont of Amblyomma nuttalli]
MSNLKTIIKNAYLDREKYHPNSIPDDIQQAIYRVIEDLDKGKIRVVEKQSRRWVTNEWIKMAILLFFKIEHCKVFRAGYTSFYDKMPLKYTDDTSHQANIRIVPHALIRKGAYLAPNIVLMPSYINIGAYINSGTLIDTWATVGSCAYIGKNVHLSGGSGIGGVLEPIQAQPTIIEDDCFIGARSEIVEGVIIEQGSVISMGVFIGQSTPIYDRQTQEITYGRVPAGSVVIPGSLPSRDGNYNRYSAIIIKQVDEKTRSKTLLNKLLREV